MKTEIRIFYSAETDPVEVYSLKTAIARKKLKVYWCWYPNKLDADKVLAGIKASMFELILAKGINLDFSKPFMTCGTIDDSIAALTAGPVPTSEIQVGIKDILASLA